MYAIYGYIAPHLPSTMFPQFWIRINLPYIHGSVMGAMLGIAIKSSLDLSILSVKSPGDLGFDSSWEDLGVVFQLILRWSSPKNPPNGWRGFQPLDSLDMQLRKPEASLSRKMLCSGSQDTFFFVPLCQRQKIEKTVKPKPNQSFSWHSEASTFQLKLFKKYFTAQSSCSLIILIHLFSRVFGWF